MFEKFTPRARRVMALSQEEARLLNHNFIGTEHLLLGLIEEGEGIAAQALDELGISLEAARDMVRETVGSPSTPAAGSPPFTPRAKKVLELSLREALQLGHGYIGTEHILLGVVREGEGVGARVLVGLGADLPSVRQRVIDLVPADHRPSGVARLSRRRRGAGDPARAEAGDPARAEAGDPARAEASTVAQCPTCGSDLAGHLSYADLDAYRAASARLKNQRKGSVR